MVALEMSLIRTSPWRRPPALLPWLLGMLWALFLPCPATPMTDPAPAPPSNSTLLFDNGPLGLRNCSCSTDVQDCNVALANMQCNCRTVPRSALTPGGLREKGGLIVWMWEPWILQELLNGSEVSDLRLSFCGPSTLPTQSLAVFGLRRLRVHSDAQGVPHRDQALNIAYGAWDNIGVEGSLADPPSSSILRVSFLDVAVLNGASALKAYSVVGPTVPTFSQHFPYLTLPPPPSATNNPPPSDTQQICLLTFIY